MTHDEIIPTPDIDPPLTALDLFALHAMQALLTAEWNVSQQMKLRPQFVAEESYAFAEAMLAEKRRRETP